MGKRYLLIIAGLLFCNVCSVSADQVLVKNGKAAGTIWLEAAAKPGEKTAADELKTYLRKMSGADF